MFYENYYLEKPNMNKNIAKVYFYSYSQGNPLNRLSKLLKKSSLLEMITRNDHVAIKLHMGEMGGIRYIRPAFVSRVVELIKSKGVSLFYLTL